jgi:MoaA/NifB/PqqE/SkfB family radical SAM enzyme
MKYVDVINKHRKPTVPDIHRTVSCWAPFQSIHINKRGELKVCPFTMRKEVEHKNITPYEKPPIKATWSPGKSLRDLWQNDEAIEEIREKALEGDLHDWCRYCQEQCHDDKPPSSLDFDWVGGPRDINHEVPKEIEFELSNTCNYQCKFCSPYHSSQHMEAMGYNLSDKMKKDIGNYIKKDISDGMPWDEYKEFMNKLNPTYLSRFESIYDDPEVADAFIEELRDIIHEVHRVNFTGGEPFAQRIVHKILKMIEEENPKNLKIQITTNGSILNGYARKLAQRPNTKFVISLDSIDPDIYPDLRRNGDLNNVLKHIDELIEYNVAQVGCSFVISKDNVYTLPRILSFCNRKGLEFSYHILSPMGGTNTLEDIAPWAVEAESKDYLQKLRDYLNNAVIEQDFHHEKDPAIVEINMRMYNQYIERLK